MVYWAERRDRGRAWSAIRRCLLSYRLPSCPWPGRLLGRAVRRRPCASDVERAGDDFDISPTGNVAELSPLARPFVFALFGVVEAVEAGVVGPATEAAVLPGVEGGNGGPFAKFSISILNSISNLASALPDLISSISFTKLLNCSSFSLICSFNSPAVPHTTTVQAPTATVDPSSVAAPALLRLRRCGGGRFGDDSSLPRTRPVDA